MSRLSFGGLVVAALALAASLTPSLLPRDWGFQLLVSGIVTAIGYGIGVLGSHLWRRLPFAEPPGWVKRTAWAALAVAAPVGIGVMLVRGIAWQLELHRMMDVDDPWVFGYVAAVPAALLLAHLLVAVARGLRAIGRRVSAVLGRWIPRQLAGMISGLLVAALLIGLLDGVVIRAFFAAADNAFRVSDGVVAADVQPPTSPLRSGSPDSLVDWEELGSKGRAFVTEAAAVEDLEAFAGGAPAEEPIRVYVGLSSTEDVAERAALVVEELERTGAFDREVLCVITPTGTGWVDPVAALALEYLWGGDTALAAMQYSYLPSWLSFLVDSSRAREAGAELFNAVHERWAALPEDDRPRLLVFGESLGADGAEAAFSGVADIRNRTDGVLWVGPPRFSELWSTFVERRDPGSPEHLPVYDGGATVRFAARPEDLEHPDAPWYRPRVVYLQHASDPVVWWSPRLILRRPDWLREPPGRDVLGAMEWFPLVTFWQVTGDLANAAGVPAGHGHDYGSLVADAWAAIAAPPGWTAQDTERLRARLIGEGAARVET